MVDLEERTDLEKTMDPTEEDPNYTHNFCEDLSDDDLDKFIEKGCGCRKGKDNKPCFTLFNKEDYQNHRDVCSELTCKELDLVILAKIEAHLVESDTIHNRPATERIRTTQKFYHKHNEICKETFLTLHRIGRFRLKELKKHYIENGLVPRVHGNTKRLPAHARSFEDIQYVVKFLNNYAQEHALLLPGRVPGYKRDDVQLLPTCTTKKSIHQEYFEACEQANRDPVAETTFLRYWRQLTPHITRMKPMTDLCWQCQQNSTAILRAANRPEQAKTEVVKSFQAHIDMATKERSFYKKACEDSKKTLEQVFTTDNVFTPPAPYSRIKPCTNDIVVHFSFDMAQQVHYPYSPQQPGPIYFLTPRKCAIFGVCCEAIPRQINYFIDEAAATGKGANTIISLLHHFLETHNFGEAELHLHADNCSGQNKNRYMMQYLAWRVMTGRNKKITLSFLIVGHTKFSPDWCFGLFKRQHRRSKVDCLDCFVDEKHQDSVCPRPAGYAPPRVAPTKETEQPAEEPPPKKRKQVVCSQCNKPGHNRRSCGEGKA